MRQSIMADIKIFNLKLIVFMLWIPQPIPITKDATFTFYGMGFIMGSSGQLDKSITMATNIN